MRTNLLFVRSEAIGYGRFGVQLAAALARAGVDIYDDLPSPDVEVSKFIPAGARSAVCAHVAWLSTPGHARGWWKGQTKSIFSMWESNILPEPFRESLDQFDTIVVPSEQNQELFSRYHKNVHYVPLGINPDDWHPIERPTLDGPFFNFFISGGGKRKGSDLVIDAFRKVFDTWPDGMPIPRLFVHTAKAQEIPHDERIQLITGLMTPEEEKAMYASAHAFVFPSRGEGFGLRPLQAIAQGMPTIATDAHGHRAFSHLMTHPLPWTLTETPPQSFHHGPAGSWWEPDFEALCESMLDVYHNYESYVVEAADNAKRAVKELNWDETARKYLDAIGRENLELPDIEPTEWIKPKIRRYLVRVNQPRLMEVGGTQSFMEPARWEAADEGTPISEIFPDAGEIPMRLAGATHIRQIPRDYWEPADVKRILFESGVLDVSCLPQNLAGHAEDNGAAGWVDIDSGLTEEQFTRIPGYTASHSLCPTCCQRLNSNRPTLEELEQLPMPGEW